jgi:hypothetical protein
MKIFNVSGTGKRLSERDKLLIYGSGYGGVDGT